jgi:hypothetical protein
VDGEEGDEHEEAGAEEAGEDELLEVLLPSEECGQAAEVAEVGDGLRRVKAQRWSQA